MRRLILPHKDTHHRAHAWHPFSFLLYIAAVLSIGWGALTLPQVSPSILGYASSITPEEIAERANTARTTRGVPPLSVNALLAKAAQEKAKDMVTKDYWAHVSPTGIPPWTFITDAGYSYSVAGENLARNFEDPQTVIDAWLASPSHRDNLINAQYTEMGVAVMNGVMNGVETTLVVHMFGKPAPIGLSGSKPQRVLLGQPQGKTGGAYGQKEVAVEQPLLSPLGVSKRFALILLAFLGGLLILDYMVLFRRGVARTGSRNAAHLMLLAFLIMALYFFRSGRIL